MSISSNDIVVPPKAYAGDLVNISAIIHNSGDNANNVNVSIYNGVKLIDTRVIVTVPTSTLIMSQWNTTGLSPRTYRINITVKATGDTNISNNKAGVNITLLKKPLPIIVIESLQASPSIPVDGSKVTINATVRNDGDANSTVNANFLVDNVSIGTDPLVLPFGTKKNVTMAWNTTGKEGTHQIAVTVGSVKKTQQITVAHKPVAVFEVVKVWISDKAPTEGRDVTVYAEVKNVGDAPGEAIIVFKDNTNTFASSSNKPKVFLPGENQTYHATWSPKSGNQVLRVEVQDHPEAQNFISVKPASAGKSACGFQTIMPGFIVLGGCVGIVRFARPGKRRVT